MYDAIVVGARCAGSPTAMLLARRGYRVLLVDRSTFPSDMPLSTHLIWQAGVAQLKRWGLLDRIRASDCPPLTRVDVDLGPFTLTGSPATSDGVTEAYCPRRTILDKILVDAAVEAGVELREGFSVDQIVMRDRRVGGLQGKARAGSPVTETAQLVIGADGMHSTVARLAHATRYHAKPAPQGTYFTYWSGVPIERIEYSIREHRAAYAFGTNAALVLVGVNWTARDFPAVRADADIEGQYLAVLGACSPSLAERVRSGRRESRWVGGSVENFFRQSHGPGWALVGDAGYTKDFCTAQGITDAFRDADAELLAGAVDDGLSGRQSLDEALAGYERRRNEVAMPFYEFTCQLAPFDPPEPEMLQLFAALHGNQTAIDRFLGLFAETVQVPEFFAPDNIQRIIGAAARGGA